MSADTIVNIAAKTDKAGRRANQDNFLLIPDVGNVGGHNPEDVNRDRPVIIPSRGTLLVVADGMGGMNAGEVASQTIVSSLRNSFSDVPSHVFNSDGTIIDFIDEAINAADIEVKNYARRNRNARGLGSTIVLAWFLDDKVYCAWCGDSRIYCYNPAVGLERISHDHSYVQALVDAGTISENEAFTHPDSNIITRSIGDNDEIVRPDTRIVRLREGDTWLLCSDGLCGLIRDHEIESVIATHPESSLTTLRSLWQEGEQTGWTDNCTILLLSVIQLGTQPASAPTTSAVGDWDASASSYSSPITTPYDSSSGRHGARRRQLPKGNRWMILTLILLVAVIAIVLLSWWWMSKQSSATMSGDDGQMSDAVESVVPEHRPATQQARPVPSSRRQPAPAKSETDDPKPSDDIQDTPSVTDNDSGVEVKSDVKEESSGLNAGIRNQYNSSKTSDVPEEQQ